MKKIPVLHLFLFIMFLLSFSALADRTYVGAYLYVRATRNAEGTGKGTDHKRFIKDFKELLPVLKSKGINTMVFSLMPMAYHYQCDPKLAAVKYPGSGGFTTAEIQEMAKITRANDMKIVIATQTLSHMEYNAAMGTAYPEYMVFEGNWKPGLVYTKRSDFVEHKGKTYRCNLSHFSTKSKEPGTPGGKSCWMASVRSTRNPWNKAGEDLIFKMIDELIAAFTVDGKKPEAFNIECDEAYNWPKVDLKDPGNVKNLSHAEIYAMAVNKLAKHIKSTNPGMDVMMWSDMLDPIMNGAKYKTADAINHISKGIIMVDWRYNLYRHRYNFKTGLYPSVEELTNKGFKVITASWNEPEATKALIWTGNMAEAKGGTILGHIYTSWTPSIPGLNLAFKNIKTPPRVSGVAQSINETADLVGLKKCAQTDTSSGKYPNCVNCNSQDGIYGKEYRDYFLGKSGPEYKIISLPLDPVSYWDFAGDANDRSGKNNGKLENGAKIVNDSERGQVLSLDGVNDYVSVADSASLDMKDALTVSFWFKFKNGKKLVDFRNRMSLLGKYYTEYEIMAYPRGHLKTYSSNGKPDKYESGVSTYNSTWTWETGKWYHAAWVMDGKNEFLYINGELMGKQSIKKHNGTLPGTNNLNIGRRSRGGSYFNGCMDDVMIFNRALATPELNFLYLTQQKDPSAYAKLLKKQ